MYFRNTVSKACWSFRSTVHSMKIIELDLIRCCCVAEKRLDLLKELNFKSAAGWMIKQAAQCSLFFRSVN